MVVDSVPEIKYKPSMKFMQSFAGKNVLVTGATGAVGSSVCRKLIKAGVGKLVMFLKDKQRLDCRIENAR
jgi:FlaA1/EpsC-like NDP-sugar epimerase